MKKRVLRIIGLLPLLFATALLGTGVSAAQTAPATLTWARCWIHDDPGSATQTYNCEFSVDNPNEDDLEFAIKFEDEEVATVPRFSDEATIHVNGNAVVNWDAPASPVTIRGYNHTTNWPKVTTDFEQEVPMPGSWP